MASRNRIFNIDHNCFYDRGVIALGINNCAITWVKEGVSVRCLTEEEKREAEFKQTAAIEAINNPILPNKEIPGFRFMRPRGSKYVAPSHEIYEELEDPLAVRTCRWPRKSQEWPSRSHVDQVIAQMETLS
jgi:hypothetical protein